MKTWVLSFVLLLISVTLFGQDVPRYVLTEHFTNTWCPICSSRNPDFYALIQKYPKNVHHVSIHPPIPYSGCPLYQYNKQQNTDRTAYYKIQGTPAVVLNGGPVNGGYPLLSEDVLKKEIAKTSPLQVIVSETKNGGNRSATITLKSSGPISGDLRLFVMLVEKNLRFTASNGELDHYDVFRKFITPGSGQIINIPNSSEQKFEIPFQDTTGWKPEEIYALAFVQNAVTNEVLNSGTRFDQLTSATSNKVSVQNLKIYPTLAKDLLFIESPLDDIEKYDIINIQGQTLATGTLPKSKFASIGINMLPQGVYWIKMQQPDGIFLAKFVKQ
ncbi:MAG: Omp28-related outer membrane protein [Saprospiraceae bacterium]